MIRRLQVSLRPTAALAALTALHAPPEDIVAAPGASAAAVVFGARFGQDVARAFEGAARALEVFGQCLDWLERRGLCAVERPRARAGLRVPTWRAAAEVKVDVRGLSRELVEECDDPDSRSRASAWAIRAVLRHLATESLHACEVRVGGERIPAAEAVAAFDAAVAPSGFGPAAAPPPRLAHLARPPRRREEPVARATAAERPAVAPVAPPTRVEPARVDAERRRRGPAAPAERVASKTGKRAPAAGAAGVAGFGGLPDDAQPEDRREQAKLGPRGLGLDAEFFLAAAGIAAWPCDAATLERGRRMVVAKLHPDRAGEASAESFHRATQGHAELAKKLPPAPRAGESAPSPGASVEASSRVSDPSPVAPPKAVATSPARPTAPPRRAPRKAGPVAGSGAPEVEAASVSSAPSEASPSATRSTVRPIEGPRATTFEWPPRPVEAEAPRARVG